MKHFIIIIIFAISSITFAQNTLEYTLKVGDKFTVEQVANQHITQDINGVDQVIDNSMINLMHFEVVDMTPENYTLSMTFKRLKMLMSSPTLGELSNSDTESADSSNITNMLFKGLLDVPVTIVMEKNGKIKSVTGGEQLIDSMFASAGMDQPEVIATTKGQMEKQFGSEALSNSFEQMTHFYPLEAVSVGKEWTNSYKGNMSAINIWKLESVTDSTINISGVAKTSISTIDENVMMTLTGTQKTSVVSDPKTGLFSLVTVVGEHTGDALFKVQNMTIPTTIKSTVTYKILQ